MRDFALILIFALALSASGALCSNDTAVVPNTQEKAETFARSWLASIDQHVHFNVLKQNITPYGDLVFKANGIFVNETDQFETLYNSWINTYFNEQREIYDISSVQIHFANSSTTTYVDEGTDFEAYYRVAVSYAYSGESRPINSPRSVKHRQEHYSVFIIGVEDSDLFLIKWTLEQSDPTCSRELAPVIVVLTKELIQTVIVAAIVMFIFWFLFGAAAVKERMSGYVKASSRGTGNKATMSSAIKNAASKARAQQARTKDEMRESLTSSGSKYQHGCGDEGQVVTALELVEQPSRRTESADITEYLDELNGKGNDGDEQGSSRCEESRTTADYIDTAIPATSPSGRNKANYGGHARSHSRHAQSQELLADVLFPMRVQIEEEKQQQQGDNCTK